MVFSGDLVNENELISGRVEIVQLGQFKLRAGHGLCEAPGRLRILALDGDHPAAGAGGRYKGLHGLDNRIAVAAHDMLIGVEQRLAFTPVGDHRVHLGVVLDVGRKTGTTFTDYASVTDQF